MNPVQRSMCGQLARLMAEFYAIPENERRYQEWLISTREPVKARQEKRGPATNDSRATSTIGQPHHTTTVTTNC